ncbi:MAG TPA: hypothetical protein VEQ63_06070, partial [Bryobacteraceae bacterium]|nr:hypothetical protein [Bryobacteraceae bacterium]
MTESEFSDAIQFGLGRAILYARTHDVEPFRKIILDACLHCYSADPQSEGTRAPYMLELVKLTNNPEFFYEAILRSLENCGDDWDAVQRFRLASYMAMDGDEHSKRAMYLNFNPGPRMVEETAIDFVRMDGIDGLLFAAEREGALLRTNPTDVDEGHLLSHAVESFGEEQTLYALRWAAEMNPNIAAYVSAAESHRATMAAHRSKSREVRALSYAQLKPRLSELRSFWLSRWGEQASLDDLHLAAADLLHAHSRDERLTYLRIFARRTFPLHHSLLVPMVEFDDEQLSVAAATAISKIEHV